MLNKKLKCFLLGSCLLAFSLPTFSNTENSNAATACIKESHLSRTHMTQAAKNSFQKCLKQKLRLNKKPGPASNKSLFECSSIEDKIRLLEDKFERGGLKDDEYWSLISQIDRLYEQYDDCLYSKRR